MYEKSGDESNVGTDLSKHTLLPYCIRILVVRLATHRHSPFISLRLTISLIDSKWKSCILDELRHRPKGFLDIIWEYSMSMSRERTTTGCASI